jgi:LacI family transcriptional regulator
VIYYSLVKRSPKKITQSQIARKAGISQTAVSAILSGSSSVNVSPETRANVLALAENLGYVGRRGSSKAGLERGEKQTVLIVESEPLWTTINKSWVASAYQAFMGRIFTASGRFLQESGRGLALFHLGERQHLTEWLAEADIEGVLWHADDSDSALLYWVATRFPLVLLNRKWHSSAHFDSVSVDQEKNIQLAADHLWSAGHRRIAVFGHVPGSSISDRRMAAYRQFVEERNLRNYTEFQEISDAMEVPPADKVAAIIRTWKGLGSQAPTALISADVFALPLLGEARRAGIAIPEDLSVIGIDNTAACTLVDPELTAIDAPFEEMCRVAIDLLIRRKASPDTPSQTIQIGPRLVERQSVSKRIESPLQPAIFQSYK